MGGVGGGRMRIAAGKGLGRMGLSLIEIKYHSHLRPLLAAKRGLKFSL